MRWSLGGNKNSICWTAANNITRVITGLPARNHGQCEDWPITVKYSWLLVTQLLPYTRNKSVLRWRCLCNRYSLVKVRNIWQSAVGHDKEATWHVVCDKWGFCGSKRNTIYNNVTPLTLEDIYQLIGVNYCLQLQFQKARVYLDYFVKEELFVKSDVTVEILSSCLWRRVVS